MRSLRWILMVAALGGAIGFVSYRLTREKPVKVIVKKADKGLIEATVVNTRAGTVEPCRRAKLAPLMGGRIKTWPVREGMVVKEGDLLLTLWNQDLEAALALAKKEALAASARADAACLKATAAARHAGRIRALAQRSVATAEDLDDAQSSASALDAECRAARAAVEQSASKVALSKADLEKTRLVAPFAGVVAQLNGELGEYVTPSPPGILTLPAVDLMDMSCVYVSAPMDEVDASKVQRGLPVRITLDAYRGKSFPGIVRRVADYVLDNEKQARTVEVEVAFKDTNDTQGLLPGLSADAEIILDRKEGVLRIPTEALSVSGKVFVLNKSRSILEERHVRIGLANWEFTQVIEGLQEGDLVVVSTDRKGVINGALAEEDIER